jgi:hypothetical protein
MQPIMTEDIGSILILTDIFGQYFSRNHPTNLRDLKLKFKYLHIVIM